MQKERTSSQTMLRKTTLVIVVDDKRYDNSTSVTHCPKRPESGLDYHFGQIAQHSQWPQ
jgi:hypothetical protein